MRKGTPIYRFLCSLAVALFVFSITPKWVWHDQFSRHIDSVHLHKDCSADDLVSLNKFCHVQEWVVATPFIEIDSPDPAPKPLAFLPSEREQQAVFQPVFQSNFNRRGPPTGLL